MPTSAPPSEATATAPAYPAAERDIFVFWDGQDQIGVDPLQVQHDLMESPDGSNLIHDCRLAEMHTPEAARALDRVVAAVRRAFGVVPFRSVNGVRAGGLKPSECVQLLLRFAAFVEDLRQSFFEPPTPAPPTAAASPDSTIEPTAAMSSTSPASTSGTPTPS